MIRNFTYTKLGFRKCFPPNKIVTFGKGSGWLGLDSFGTIWTLGSNPSDWLYGTSLNYWFDNLETPKSVPNHRTFCKISSGFSNVRLAIDNKGIGWAWGTNYAGELSGGGGMGWGGYMYDTGSGWWYDLRTINSPVQIYGNHTFCHILAGYYAGFGIDYNGKIWGWGYNHSGKLGNNSAANACNFVPSVLYGSNKTFCAIQTTQGGSMLALDKNGRGWGWGYNSRGYLGDNTTINRFTPVAVYGTKTFCEIGVSEHVSMIDKNGQAWCWGGSFYNYGFIGNNSVVNRSTPTAVYGNHTFCKIATTGHWAKNSTSAIDNHGKAWSWGGGYKSRL